MLKFPILKNSFLFNISINLFGDGNSITLLTRYLYIFEEPLNKVEIGIMTKYPNNFQ